MAILPIEQTLGFPIFFMTIFICGYLLKIKINDYGQFFRPSATKQKRFFSASTLFFSYSPSRKRSTRITRAHLVIAYDQAMMGRCSRIIIYRSTQNLYIFIILLLYYCFLQMRALITAACTNSNI